MRRPACHASFLPLPGLRALIALAFAAFVVAAQGQSAAQPTVLYGAAYYNEYMPADLQPGRLDKDIALMKQAGINVVRMGESTWSLWEPEDGHFEYAWMDRVVDAMGKAGIKVIMGTPTYSIPTWMVHGPSRDSRPPLGGDANIGYGMRQNMDTDNPNFRFYAERVIRNLVSPLQRQPRRHRLADRQRNRLLRRLQPRRLCRLRRSPQAEVRHHRRASTKPGSSTTGAKTSTIGPNMPTRDNATSTSYKLEWSRWQQMRVTDYLTWQAALVRQYRRPDQFVTQDFGGMMHADVNEIEIAKSLDIVANNIYHGTQDHMDGAWQADAGRLCSFSQAQPTSSSPKPTRRLSAGTPPASSRPMTARCASTSTAILLAAPTWSSTGTGTRSTPARRRTGKAFSATTSSPTAPTPKSPAPRTNCRRSARS